MATVLNPYLSFTDIAREAMGFYHSVFGGTLDISTMGEAMPDVDPAEAHKVMHSQLSTPGGLTLMGADTPAAMGVPIGNATVSLSGQDETELRGYWDALMAGGAPAVPLEASPWGDLFGMGEDKFGVTWMVNIAVPAAG